MKTRATGAISLTLVLAMLLSMVSPALATGTGGNNSENIVITNTTVNGVTYDSDGNPVSDSPDVSEPSDEVPPNDGTDVGEGDSNMPEPENPTEPVETPDVSQEPVAPSERPEPSPAPSETPVEPSEPVETPEPTPSPDVSETPSPAPSEPVETDKPGDEIPPTESPVPEISLMATGSMNVNNGNIILTPGVSTLSGSTTAYYVEANQPGNYTVTLSNVTINTTNKDDRPAIKLASGVNMTLILDGTNAVKSGVGAAGINVPAGATLTIQGTGSLTVDGGASGSSTSGNTATRQEAGAGIGGNYNQACGTIIINSGTINATGGYKPYYGAAGIGGGSASQGSALNSDDTGVAGRIEINGGTVTAKGSIDCQYGASGIGGGSYGNGRNIIITAGTVTSEGSRNAHYGASGIGGGVYGHAHDITISGGTVKATVSQLATVTGAGIGAGSNGNGYNITISGGNIQTFATSADSLCGAAIGGGGGFADNGEMGGAGELSGTGHGYNINISGGTLNLETNSRGAGIGGGASGYGKDITITGGNITVTHIMGRLKGGAGIGGGSDGYGQNIIINGLTPITMDLSAGYGGAGIGGGSYGGGENIEITGDVNITYSRGYDGGAGIGGGSYRDGKDINIHGSLVRAYFISSSSSFGSYGAGIGGGNGGYGININISDCTAENGNVFGYAIRANGGSYGAGIGTGHSPGAGYTDIESVAIDVPDTFNVLTNIKISNSNVYATAGSYGAAIGTGYSGSNSTVNRYASVDIDGGKIYAWTDDYGAGIGTGYNTKGGMSNDIRSVVRFDIDIKNVTTLLASGYRGAGIGSGRNSDYCDFNVSMSACDNVTVSGRGQNSWYESPSGIGTGWESDYVNVAAKIDNIITFTATTAGGGGAIGTGSNGVGNNVSFEITNVETLSARSTYSYSGSNGDDSSNSGTGIGLGYSASNSTAKFVIHDVDHIVVPSGGNAGIASGGFNTNCVSDYDIYDIGDINVTAAIFGIGSGIRESGTAAKFTMDFQRIGGITVNVTGGNQSSGIGTGYSNYDNTVSLVFDDCGIIDSQLTSTSSNNYYSNKGVAIGVGGNTRNSDVSLRFTDTGNIIAKGGAYQYSGIGTGSNVYNTKTDIYMRPKTAGSSIVVAVNYYGTGIGAGPGNYGSSSSSPYSLKIDIADYTNGIRIDLNNAYTTGVGIGRNNRSGGVGQFESSITLNNCGSIVAAVNSNYQYVTGIGSGVSSYGPFENSIFVSNMPGGITLNLSNPNSGYWAFNTGIGTGGDVYNQIANSEQQTNVELTDIGNISITGSYESVGIGTGRRNYVSNNNTAKINNVITLLRVDNIEITGGTWSTGIGVGAGSTGYDGENNFKTTILVSDGGDIMTNVHSGGTGIGVTGYDGHNGVVGYAVGADIQISNCGNIIANGSANTNQNPLNSGTPYGVGIGIGSYNYNSGRSSQSDGDISILIQDVKSVTTTGSKYGAAIGTSGSTYYTTGLSVDINTTDGTVIPVAATAGEFASAIGAGHNNHGSGVKADIKITNANIIAVSEKAAPIGVGQSGDGGETKITLTNCVIDQAQTSDGPGLGISRGTSTNGAKLTAVLNNVTGDFTAGGYAAGVGVGANCIAAQMDLTLNNSTIAATGVDGGAGIGTGPLNTGCTLKLRADSSEITATGSGTNKTEFDVVGSKNNDILDDLAKANILGAGAGIGGSKGPQGLDIEFLNSTVVATGGGVNDYCAAGIGSGRQGDSGKITITGGEITATGGHSETEGAAGIGSGTAGKVGTITINSGIVKAYGSNGTKLGGAGIGSGADSTGSGVIVINDGEVYAYGSERGAGIGGGSRGSGALVTINGGKVYAKGGLFDTAGIGGGTVPQGDTDTEKYGVLTITDINGYPDIHAYGSSYALAITSDIITSDSVRILQGTLLNVPKEDTDLTVKRLADGRDGEAVAIANLPANYDAFSLTLPQGDADDTEYNVYMDVQENGVAETYLLATPEQVENFPVTKSEFYAAKQLNIVKFFTITFETNGGSKIESQLVRISGIPEIPASPTRTGYVFAGWYADPECETMFDFSNPIEADATVYANWIEGEGILYETYHYKQTLDGDYAIGNIEYHIGKPGDTVTAVRKTYEGFNYVKDHANAVPSGVLTEGGDKLILKLYYDRKIITVQFVNIENDGQFASSMSAPWGTSILLGTPSKMYYDFDKWTKLDADGETIPMIPTRIETMGPTLYANWILKDGAEYQVKHYQRQLDGNYICVLIEQYADAVGKEVQAVYKNYEGFTVNESISTEASKGIAQADNSTILKVYYDRNKITVRLLDTYMPTMTEQTREYGALANLPIPSRDGYAFAGWYTDDEELVTNDMTINDLGEQVTAKWTAGADIVYSVRYFLQDSTGEYKISEYYSLRGQAGNEVKIEPKTLQGYTFEPDMSNLVGVIKGDGSLSLDLYYSILTYKVSFESNGGTTIPSQDAVYYGGVITPVSDPVKTGYIFDGWYMDEGCEIEFNILQPILGETILYAKWLPGMSEYKVQHWVETQDGAGYRLANEEVLTGVTDSMVIAQLKNYDGCAENINHPDRISTGKVSSAGDLVLKVYYSRKPVTVIYETLGGDAIEDVVLKYGDTADDLTATRAGYDFAGWYTNISLTKKFDFSTSLQKDLTLYAKWTPRNDTVYTVEYYWQNPDMPAIYDLHETKEFTGRTEAAVHAKIEKYDGLVQNEDYHDSNVVGIITGDGSLVLRVYYDREECLVSFEANGGKAVPVATVLFDGHLAPKATTKTGYDFAGWYKDEDLTEAWDSANDRVVEDLTLYAMWTAAEGTAYQVEHWTQNIDLDGYELKQTEPFIGTTDETVTASAIEIYGFAENEDAEGRVVEGDIKPDGSLVLKVYYDRVTFNVSFETDGGTEIETASVLYEKKLSKPNDPEKTGYVFDGWYEDEAFVTAYDFDSKVTEDMRIYAKYKPASGITYTVQRWLQTVDKSEYILGSEEELAGTTGESVSVLKKDIAGFTANGDGDLTGTVKADGSLVLTAFYDRNDYKITFDAQNGDENETKDVTYGATFECPVVTKTGYEFLGWFDKNGVEIKPEYTMPARDLDLFAHWKAALGTAYKIEHWVQDITGTDYELESTDELTGQTDSLVTAEYKSYDGFTAQEDNEATVKTGYVAADGSLVLKLYYTRNQYSVRFVTNCSQALESQVVYFKAHATDPGELTKTGYVFEGWYVDPEFKTPVNFDIMPIVQNTTLYGKWASADDTVYKTRHYVQDVNGDGYSLKETIESHGTTDAIATAIAQSYYGFVENQSHKDRIPEAVVSSDGSTVLALYYDRLDYEVSFDTNGGNDIVPQVVKYEAGLAPVQDPAKPGYDFAGWYSDILLTMPADLTIQSVTENRTYYAKWTAADGTAYKTEYWTMGLDGNYALKAFEMSYGDTDLAVSAVVKPIPGFQHNPDAAGSNLAGVILADGSLVLKVYYDRLSYVLTVDADNDSEPQTREVLFENAIGELPQVSKSGYEFAGWYDEENREIDKLTTMPAHDMTVKAHWNKQPDIVFPPSGGGGTVRTYEIKILVNEGGVTDPNEAKVKVTSGKDQTIRIIPDAGYKILNVFVDGKDMGDISEFKFEKVKADHEIQVTFAHICYIEDYSDVDLNAWYHENLDWGVANGFFKGYDETHMAPCGKLTRAEAAQVVARMYDYQSDVGVLARIMMKAMFSDVSLEAWYASAVQYDNAKGYLIGYGDGRFGPQDNLTREQMAQLLYRLAGKPEVILDDKKRLADMDRISDWAQPAMDWAIQNEIVVGDDRRFVRPQDAISRAEAAAMFQRFQELDK